MFVLLGYLVALTMLLGSAYLGLEWLASPDDVTTHRHPPAKISQSAPVPPKRPTIQSPDSKEANVEKNNESARDKAADSTVGMAQKSDAVPTRQCVPIGLTAKGEMVFPLQCRQFIEGQRGPATPTADPAPAPPLAPDSGSQKGSNKRTDVALSAATKPVSSSGPSTAQDKRKTAGLYDHRGSERQADAAAPDEVAPNDVSASISAKQLHQRPTVELKPKQSPKRHSGPDSSKIVTVVQEADAHRKQPLVGLNLRMTADPNWYNPLGLR